MMKFPESWKFIVINAAYSTVIQQTTKQILIDFSRGKALNCTAQR